MAGMVIIGAGECGARAAFALREAGHDGPVTLIGEEAHLPYERPPLSKTTPAAARPIAGPERYAAANIGLLTGVRVRWIDPARRVVESDDGRAFAFDKLLIATGARARRLPGMEAARTLRTIDDAHAILGALDGGARLDIVGGGFIGLELAATARAIGARVTVVEAAARLMARVVPQQIAAVAEARHRAAGVDIILGADVRQAGPNRIVLADGRTIECDIVVAAVGAVPETALARDAAITVDNGIVVDGALQTSVPDIFAAGDCCAFPYRGGRVRLESWRAAVDQAGHAAAAMLGSTAPYSRVPWFWSDQYELTLQVAGLPEPGLPTLRRDLGDGAFVLFQLGGDGRLVSASGIGTGNALARDIRLAEIMIERGVSPDPQRLADAGVNLKALLKG